MDGVEILNRTEIMKSAWSWDVFWVFFLIFAGIGLLVGFFVGLDRYEILADTIVGVVVGAIIGAVIRGSLACTITVPTGTYEYQVIISEDVNFVEFNEKYEIIKQEGKIYTVVLKEDKED